MSVGLRVGESVGKLVGDTVGASVSHAKVSTEAETMMMHCVGSLVLVHPRF